MSQPQRCWPQIKRASSGTLRHLPGTLGPLQFPGITPDLTCYNLSAPIWPTQLALSTRSHKRPQPSKESQMRELTTAGPAKRAGPQQGHGTTEQGQPRELTTAKTRDCRAGLPRHSQNHLSLKIRRRFGQCRKTEAMVLVLLRPLRALQLYHIPESVWSLAGSGRSKQ